MLGFRSTQTAKPWFVTLFFLGRLPVTVFNAKVFSNLGNLAGHTQTMLCHAKKKHEAIHRFLHESNSSKKKTARNFYHCQISNHFHKNETVILTMKTIFLLLVRYTQHPFLHCLGSLFMGKSYMSYFDFIATVILDLGVMFGSFYAP